ncbi:MAG: tRNA (adenosine(37)-N6)-threonylcarbamoyltransferase complex transferase subunit TsaD [bacterium]|nr:tRNA (adenosine(37)-N6)-threonylcarbamoyltransferase complex transferase subunit TsaD [bacterium]
MKILAIETSCDETSIAIVDFTGTRVKPKFQVLSHLISSQVELHAKFGGVVPNLARREHQRNLVPMLLHALKEAGMTVKKRADISDRMLKEMESLFGREPELWEQMKKQLHKIGVSAIDVIVVTNGPGLAPALWVGINFAKALSLLWKKPLIPVNHMKGHLYSAFIEKQVQKKKRSTFAQIKFPVLALLVSGGHTELVLMKKFGHYQIIGETLDDAAGEAFDKVARMLELGYPGGPAISSAAEEIAKFKNLKIKSFPPKADLPPAEKIKFPRPMISSPNFNFSFSGLKTSVLYFIRDIKDKKRVRLLRPAIAKEFQDAVVDVLAEKTLRAARTFKARTIVVGGGVSANELLRQRLSRDIKKNMPHVRLFLPHPSVTGDNALMVALAAFIGGKKKAPKNVGADANMRL